MQFSNTQDPSKTSLCLKKVLRKFLPLSKLPDRWRKLFVTQIKQRTDEEMSLKVQWRIDYVSPNKPLFVRFRRDPKLLPFTGSNFVSMTEYVQCLLNCAKTVLQSYNSHKP